MSQFTVTGMFTLFHIHTMTQNLNQIIIMDGICGHLNVTSVGVSTREITVIGRFTLSHIHTSTQNLCQTSVDIDV